MTQFTPQEIADRILNGLDALANKFHILGDQAETDRRTMNTRYSDLRGKVDFTTAARIVRSEFIVRVLEEGPVSPPVVIDPMQPLILCPQCHSSNVSPTEGNGVGNLMDCRNCGTDFTLCPDCGTRLEHVRYAGGYLNDGQFDAIRAGDYYCKSCKGTRAATGFRYFWLSELQPAQ